MADLICPQCGMPNPAEQNVCSFCRQPLRGPEDSQPIRAGDVPTKKSTAELEEVLPEWLRDVRSNARNANAEEAIDEFPRRAEQSAPPKDEFPDLLAGLASVSSEEQDDEIPEWMRSAAPPPASAKPEKTEPGFTRQEIRWDVEPEDELGGMATLPLPSAPESGDAMLPWMRDAEKPVEEKPATSARFPGKEADASSTPSPFASGTFQPPGTGELTNWLDKLGAEVAEPAGENEPETAASLDNWLSSLTGDNISPAAVESGEAISEEIGLPEWMSPATEPPVASKEKSGEPPMPDWMAAFREKIQPDETPAPVTGSTPEVPSAPAFVPDEMPVASNQADELFSIDMPDWLSGITPTDQKSDAVALQVEVPSDAISPAELPSWVQAMRPMETILPDVDKIVPLADGPVEAKGPLVGLRGILPLTDLIRPGKPKAHAIRLQVSESQQTDATLLDQLLASETQAEPLRGGGGLTSQRVLRWVISGLLILLVSFFILTGMQTVPLPATLPDESALALPVLDALPDGAPVLMVFDYEPALSGELKVTASSFVDRMLGLHHPRVAILSTSPTGPALAEQFFMNTQGRHGYQSGQDYINLGYLPGGPTGILSFAENPREAIPSTLWDGAAMQGVNHFSDYALVVLLTDQAETARSWVEQTALQRDGRPLLVISSAQAAPMIQPYLFTGQVNGLVSGLYGGAAFEGAAGQGDIVRRYWDAYNYAMLFVVLLIVFGGVWNWIAGVRSRRQGLDEV